MKCTPAPERLARIPRLNETDAVPLKDKVIYLHFFLLQCDWYVAEYDGEDIFFGYSILNGDLQNAAWGDFSFRELKELSYGPFEVECELEECWLPVPAHRIPEIKKL